MQKRIKGNRFGVKSKKFARVKPKGRATSLIVARVNKNVGIVVRGREGVLRVHPHAVAFDVPFIFRVGHVVLEPTELPPWPLAVGESEVGVLVAVLVASIGVFHVLVIEN